MTRLEFDRLYFYASETYKFTHEHIVKYKNARYGIMITVRTPYKNGQPGYGKATYEWNGKTYSTRKKLFEAVQGL